MLIIYAGIWCDSSGWKNQSPFNNYTNWSGKLFSRYRESNDILHVQWVSLKFYVQNVIVLIMVD